MSSSSGTWLEGGIGVEVEVEIWAEFALSILGKISMRNGGGEKSVVGRGRCGKHIGGNAGFEKGRRS